MKEIITCGIFLFNSENRFLVGHPTNSEKLTHNFYSIPKGWNEDGESFFMSAKRELMEETNIDLDTIGMIKSIEVPIHKYIGYNPLTNGMSNKRIASYLINTNIDFSNYDIKCESMVTHLEGDPFPEIDEFRWITIEEGFDCLHESQITPLQFVKKFI